MAAERVQTGAVGTAPAVGPLSSQCSFPSCHSRSGLSSPARWPPLSSAARLPVRRRRGRPPDHGPAGPQRTAAEQRFGLGEVRCEDRTVGQQAVPQDSQCIGVQQAPSSAGRQHRVDHEGGQPVANHRLRHHSHGCGCREHPRLDRGHLHIAGDRVDLGGHRLRRRCSARPAAPRCSALSRP